MAENGITIGIEWLVVFGVLFGGVVMALIMSRRSSGETSELSDLKSRISQLFDSQSIFQSNISDQLQRQERELSKKLEDRLGDITHRVGESLNNNVQTTQKNLHELKERLAVIDTAQKNITDLSKQMVSLQDILANKQQRGIFGEIQLKDLVQNTLPPSAYEFQAKLSNDKRADCLLKLPNPPGSIVIDAKFPLEKYEHMMKAGTSQEQEKASRDFARNILDHVGVIADKYIINGETADSALMFLPSESIYAELHTNFPDVISKSYRRKVWIVSPTTMMATLNTVRAVLRDARMREQAGVIQKEVGAMIDNVGRLDSRVESLQRHFGQVSEDVRQIRISTEKVVTHAERIEDVQLEDNDNTPRNIDLDPGQESANDTSRKIVG